MNVFRRHRETTQAKAAAVSASAGETAPSSIAEQMGAQMNAHKIELKAIQSKKVKAEKKAEFIPVYRAYVDGVMSAPIAVQDDIVMTIFIWALDCADYKFALDIADWALTGDIEAPPEFTRNVQTILTEEIAEAALLDKSKISEFHEALFSAGVLVKDFDMPDQVRAKLCKALSWAQAENEPRDALRLAKDALDLDPRCGLKNHLKALEKTVQKLDEVPAAETEKTDNNKPGGDDGSNLTETNTNNGGSKTA